jgi:hypothetical protein
MNAVSRRGILPGRQAIDAAWEHFHYAKHRQGMSNVAILRSINLKTGLARRVSDAEVIAALEQAFIVMQLGAKK